jgi:rhodanese-related sulfurtransferase
MIMGVSGRRSTLTAKTLHDMGYPDVDRWAGGFEACLANG